MSILEIEAKSLLRLHKRIDSWFVSRYGLNQYRGCTHNCAYCDGRAEGYYVEGEFGRDISVKTNSADLLRRELDPARKRKPLPRGFIMLGGGVGDSYQPVEVKYRLTRGLLGVVRDFDWPVHLLTKSVLVERDLDLLTAINHQSRALVSFSLSTINDDLAARFEPGVPSPSERLAALKRLHEDGISGGVFLMPVIPHVSDLPEQITEAVAAIKATGADFIIFGGMTLKDGRQKQYFLDVLKKYDPGLLKHYDKLYGHDKWGIACSDYYQEINATFINAARVNQIPVRIPQSFFDSLIDEKDKIVVLLDQMDYLLKIDGKSSPYSYGAWTISQIKGEVPTDMGELIKLKGVGPVTARIVQEIERTGTSRYYQKLLGCMY